MKFLLFLSFVFFTVFSYSQTVKIVARKNCQVTKPCPANSSGSGILWSGIKIYDWHDHDNNPSTLDTLGWSQCVEKTVANSGTASVIDQDNCPCNTGYTKQTSSSCGVGKTTPCPCQRNCTRTCTGQQVLNPHSCTCSCPLYDSIPSFYSWQESMDLYLSPNYCNPNIKRFNSIDCTCTCSNPPTCLGDLVVNKDCQCECPGLSGRTGT